MMFQYMVCDTKGHVSINCSSVCISFFFFWFAFTSGLAMNAIYKKLIDEVSTRLRDPIGTCRILSKIMGHYFPFENATVT